MASNLTNQSRNVLCKKLLSDKEVNPHPHPPPPRKRSCTLPAVQHSMFREHCSSSHNLFLLQDSFDDINLFSIMTVMAFLLSAPLMLSVEGIKFNPSYLQSAVSLANFEKKFQIFVH